MGTLEQLENQINLEVAAFFETEPLTPELSVYDNKPDLDAGWIERGDGKYTEAPDWLVAFATHGGQIHLLSPSVMPAGYEKSGKLRFSKTLKHEIAHLYTSQLNRSAPSWLNEGTSLYVAGQNQYKQVSPGEITLVLLDELEDAKSDDRIYQIGQSMVSEIVKIGGKDLLFKIIGIQDRDKRNKLLQNTFSWLI